MATIVTRTFGTARNFPGAKRVQSNAIVIAETLNTAAKKCAELSAAENVFMTVSGDQNHIHQPGLFSACRRALCEIA